MHVIVTGGTGFIGRALCTHLAAQGHTVHVPSRNPRRAEQVLGTAIAGFEWDGCTSGPLAKLLDEVHPEQTALVNLAGENIAAGRWTTARRRAIRTSRIQAGKALAQAVRLAQHPPAVLIQGSAIGYYGPDASPKAPAQPQTLDETAAQGTGFLAGICKEWEESSLAPEVTGMRRIIVRTGLVLGKNGGILEKFIRPFSLYLGGPLGSGNQWLSWIHLHDMVRALTWLLETSCTADTPVAPEQIVNMTAPCPETMHTFCKTLGTAMQRPCWLPVPSSVLTLLLGDMARETVLASQRVMPTYLQEKEFCFAYPDLHKAFENIFS